MGSLVAERAMGLKMHVVVCDPHVSSEAVQLRIVRIDGFELEAVPDGDFLVIFNRDRPGVIADVGETLGCHSINIGQMYNGRDAQGGMAITLLRIDSEVSDEVMKDIIGLPNILNATRVHMA